MNRIDLKYHLEAFRDYVECDCYKKMSYSLWRQLSRHDDLSIEFDNGYYIIGPDNNAERFTFALDDDSFGQYLWENTNYCASEIAEFMSTNRKPTTMKNNNEEKEENTMNFNFEFGPVMQ